MVILLLVIGVISLIQIGVDLFPSVDLPTIRVTTTYAGAPPDEIESQITKHLEDQLGSIAGIKHITSYNLESASVVVVAFNEGINIDTAETAVRDKFATARPDMPADIDEPVFTRVDLSSAPILRFSLEGNLTDTQLYTLANDDLRPRIQQIQNVGDVQFMGGRKRQINVDLNRDSLSAYQFSAIAVAKQLNNTGANTPSGSLDQGSKTTVFRTVGQFEKLDQIRRSVLSFSGDVGGSVTVGALGTVIDGTEDPKTYGLLWYPYRKAQENEKHFFDKILNRDADIRDTSIPIKQCLYIDVYKQSGSNTIEVVNSVKKNMITINKWLATKEGTPKLAVISDSSTMIIDNVNDVKINIIIGIILAVLTVYLFLGNLRATVIAGIAIPVSLIGSFIAMYVLGFTINLMSLLALSIAVGLLVDDAIVVQENIFKTIESGVRPFKAAEIGTLKVMLAVIATTLAIIAVFLPLGFLPGQTGAFFKQFGITVVFAMSVSLFLALTLAPLYNAYFSTGADKDNNIIVKKFEIVQDFISSNYEKMLDFSMRRPLVILGSTLLVFIMSLAMVAFLPKTFIPAQNSGRFFITLEFPLEYSLDGTKKETEKIIKRLAAMKQVKYISATVGTAQKESNKATIGVYLVSSGERKEDTSKMQILVRESLKDMAFARPAICGESMAGGGAAPMPFMLNISGTDLNEINAYAAKVIPLVEKIPDLVDVQTSFRPGAPEYRLILNPIKMQTLGISSLFAGLEARTYVAGTKAGTFHDGNNSYDILVRLKENQRDLATGFSVMHVPNLMNKMIPISAVASLEKSIGYSNIIRQDRSRVVQISANLAPDGALSTAGMNVMKLINSNSPPPKGITIGLLGQQDNYDELVRNILIAFGLSILFIYLVLSSLYDSFIIPATIMTALPPSLTGAFIALFITRQSFNVFSMIGVVTLLGLVAKNSILLVDFAMDEIRVGRSTNEAIRMAGLSRLRPILMTSFAIIAGTLPLALGIGEIAESRMSMGIAIIGGVLLSTLVTLVVVPAVFGYIEDLRLKIERMVLSEEVIRESTILAKEDLVIIDEAEIDKTKTKKKK